MEQLDPATTRVLGDNDIAICLITSWGDDMHQACTTISKPRKEKDREDVGPGWLQIETEECLSVSKLQPSSTVR